MTNGSKILNSAISDQKNLSLGLLSNWAPKLAEHLPTKGLSHDSNKTIEIHFVTKMWLTCI